MKQKRSTASADATNRRVQHAHGEEPRLKAIANWTAGAKGILEIVFALVGILLVVQANRYLQLQTNYMDQQTAIMSEQAQPQIRVGTELIEGPHSRQYEWKQLHVVIRGGYVDNLDIEDMVLLQIVGTSKHGDSSSAWRVLDDYYRGSSVSNLAESPEWTASDGMTLPGNNRREQDLRTAYMKSAPGPFAILLLHTFVRVTYEDSKGNSHVSYFSDWGNRMDPIVGESAFKYRDAVYARGRQLSLGKLTAKTLISDFEADDAGGLTTPSYPF